MTPAPARSGALGGAPLVGWAGAALALGCALALCWPVWLTGAVYVFADTTGYLRGGEVIWGYLGDLLPDVPPDAGGAERAVAAGAGQGAGGAAEAITASGTVADARGEAAVGRSLTYSAAAYAAWAVLGEAAIPVIQAWITVMMAFSLLSARALRRPALLLAGFAWLALLTPLPFYAVFLMPDLLAAVPILFAACLVWRWDELGTGQRIALAVLAALATSSHYGTVPLALGCIGVALALRLLSGRLPGPAILATAALVVGFGPLLNLGASTAVTDEPSTAPLRLPILLARSIEDGPARWYLQRECPRGRLATCDVLGGEIPDDVGEFLWTNSGVADATPAQMAQVRAEEWTILRGAFLAYPAAQTASLLGNAARQSVELGLGSIRAADGLDEGFGRVRGPQREAARELLTRFDALVVWGSWAAVLAAGALAIVARPERRAVLAVAAVVAGLLLNAAIFGGLSAPAERYQARVIWVLPFVLLAVAADALAARAAPARGRGRLGMALR
jgi:hypothetical protein